ncbi:MAG: stage 0 sporulation protein [bacterium]|nr:stage 0 sporulation protein [bacterium]
MNLLFEIELDTGAVYEAYADESLGLKKTDYCLIKKDKYLDYGKISKYIGSLSPDVNKSEIPKIDRKATMLDKSKANENTMRAKSAYRTASNQVEKLKLPMKLLNVHYTYDRKLVTFLFTAEGRIDFRQLVKDLSQILNTRIELRQIGVRDETAILGGVGTCGQALCCCRFLKKFESINVKMAKEQDLSLNPTNISGMCGRLKCCLKYEHDDYIELDKGMPRRGSSCECAEGVGKIIDRNLLTQKVTVYLDESAKYLTCPKEEIRVIYPNKYKGVSSSKKASTKNTENDEVADDIAQLDDSKEITHDKKKRKPRKS